MTINNHTKTTPIDPAKVDAMVKADVWQRNGLHWEVRLWDVADGHPLTPDEAQRLAEWVAYTVDT
jgi:hypothetical protein